MSDTDVLPLNESSPAPDAPRVAVVTGADINKQIITDRSQRTHGAGNNDGLYMLSLIDPPIRLDRIHITPSYFRQGTRWNLKSADLIWNVITDADQNPDTLDVAKKLLAGAKAPIVNHPSLMAKTRRHQISSTLQGLDGVIAPKVLLLRNPTLERVKKQTADAGITFPVIVRHTGSHNGEVVGVFQAAEEMEAIFGDRKNEYYLIEFVDVRRADGLYRKTRFFFVGDKVVTRQHIIGEDWSLHGRSSRGVMSEKEDLLAESRSMLIDGFEALAPATRGALHALGKRIGLDYFGLDCCVMEDGRVVVFEANATMNFNPRFRNPRTQHNKAALPRMISALRDLVDAKTGGSASAS